MYKQLKADLLYLALGGEHRWYRSRLEDNPMTVSMRLISGAYRPGDVPREYLSSVVGMQTAALNRLEWLNENYPEGVSDV